MFLFFVDSVHFQWWRSFYVFLVSLAEKRLMDVKLNELGAWLGGRDFTPNGILSAIRRGEYILLRLLLVGRKNVFLFFSFFIYWNLVFKHWLIIYIHFFQLALSSSPLMHCRLLWIFDPHIFKPIHINYFSLLHLYGFTCNASVT